MAADAAHDAHDVPPRLPSPRQLAQLGVVLCLYRRQPGGELAGWSQAVRAEAESALDSDGMQESLSFYDRDGRCCWRLCLLPDSDFLSWERLAACLPPGPRTQSHAGIGERLLRRLAGTIGGGWTGSILRLHELRSGPGFGLMPASVLAASLASVSPLGATLARRIAQRHGADADGLVDECCCERAARAAARASADDEAYSLIRLNPHLHSTDKRA
ncbi:MAG: Hemin transport protein [Luteimonas sp.]|nr:Hemin transport protein [Luteimonas sp.]